MRNSLNRKLTFIFSGIVLVACLLLLGTCSWIFRSVESTVKNIRYDDILSGYKTEVKAEVETALSIVQHYYGLSQSGKLRKIRRKVMLKKHFVILDMVMMEADTYGLTILIIHLLCIRFCQIRKELTVRVWKTRMEL